MIQKTTFQTPVVPIKYPGLPAPTLVQSQKAAIEQLQTKVNNLINSTYPTSVQLNAARLAVGYTQAYQTTMNDQIDAVRLIFEGARNSIQAATDAAQINAIVGAVTWPKIGQ